MIKQSSAILSSCNYPPRSKAVSSSCQVPTYPTSALATTLPVQKQFHRLLFPLPLIQPGLQLPSPFKSSFIPRLFTVFCFRCINALQLPSPFKSSFIFAEDVDDASSYDWFLQLPSPFKSSFIKFMMDLAVNK
jgi:hypothetical protein